MSQILIIGYGNPLRGDDGFGWHLAQRLQQNFHGAEIEIIACHQLTPDLAEPISRARAVIFADASAEPTRNEIALRQVKAAQTAPTDFSHHLNPPTLLAMAQALYAVTPRAAFLVTAAAHELGYGERLSPQMICALDNASARVASLCEFLAPSMSYKIRDDSP